MKQIQIYITLLVLSSFLSCCEKEETSPAMCEQNCVLEPQVGPCNAAIPRYYFDKNEKICKEFIWGGCAGVVPFETMEECESWSCN